MVPNFILSSGYPLKVAGHIPLVGHPSAENISAPPAVISDLDPKQAAVGVTIRVGDAAWLALAG